MIKLGYLQDYSAINVPKFATATARDDAFDEYTKYTIDAYYPSYYTNVIKLSITEVPLSSRINFVILVNKVDDNTEKYYYYFVDKIRYINEDIYEIVINMDTVLTYMFDYSVTNCLITRKSINRWSGNDINRNYVRENVSEGFMEVEFFEYKEPNKYLIVTSSKNYCDSSVHSGNYKLENGTTLDFGYYVYMLPLPPFELNKLATIHVYHNNGNVNLDDVYFDDLVDYFISDPYTINMIYVESEYLDKVYGTTWRSWTSYTECSLAFTPIMSSLGIVRIDNTKYGMFNISSLDITNNHVDTKVFNFTKNTLLHQPFNYLYTPQLIDENYIQIEYGDVNGFTAYPMHQARSTTFNFYNNLDVTNGNDGYYILDDFISSNEYNTYNISLGLTFDLITDPWLEYQAQNKGTLSTGLQLQAVNTLYSTTKGIIGKVATPASNITDSRRWYNNPETKGSSYTETTKYSGTNISGATPISDGIMQGINIVANYQINRDNLQFSPDTVKGRANLYSMLFSKYKKPYYKRSMVNDIRNCARKLEEYGYRVNEIVNTPHLMQNLCNNRYYYNCVSARVICYETSCFIPNEIINNINERLENGLRFFNFNNDTSSYTMSYMLTFDNVEVNSL